MFEYFETCIALDLPAPDVKLEELPWVRYNPRKNVLRWGVSLTSLDGGTSGVPDLDSLYEYNKENGTKYSEKDFATRTDVYKKYFSFLDESFDLGRSHILRLGNGGFFPYHRDFDTQTFRLIYTISGCEPHNLVWIVNDQIIKLQNRRWYYVNTKMIHSVFSFFGSEFVVFNVLNNEKGQRSVVKHMHVK